MCTEYTEKSNLINFHEFRSFNEFIEFLIFWSMAPIRCPLDIQHQTPKCWPGREVVIVAQQHKTPKCWSCTCTKYLQIQYRHFSNRAGRVKAPGWLSPPVTNAGPAETVLKYAFVGYLIRLRDYFSRAVSRLFLALVFLPRGSVGAPDRVRGSLVTSVKGHKSRK